MSNPQGFVLLGSRSNHGGTVISASDKSTGCSTKIARIGDLHSCPIDGHGVTPIIGPEVPGEQRPIIEGKPVAKIGDRAACGAVIGNGCDKTIGT